MIGGSRRSRSRSGSTVRSDTAAITETTIARITWARLYMPIEPSGLKINISQLDKPTSTANVVVDRAKPAATASGHE